MKRDWWGRIIAAVACTGMLLPQASLAASPAVGNDVALRSGGVLVGHVVDQQGHSKAGATVSIQYADHEVARTTTDQNGVFAAKGLRGGQYQLKAQDGVTVCRLWADDTAPPAARPAALVITGNEIVRGQGPLTSWGEWMRTHPFLTAGTIAAAIAIPIAMADDDDDGS